MGARSEEYKADKIIIREGELVHRMYIVLEGEVVLYSNYGTNDEYLIGAYGKGKSFGEFNLFSDTPNMYTAVAFTDTKVVWFEKSNLSSFINGYPDYALQLIETMSKSYIRLAQNLQIAIKEINDLREVSTFAESIPSDINYDDVREFLNNVGDSDSNYRYMK